MVEQKQQAFINAYETCHDDFIRYCSALSYGKMDVDDLVQEVLLSAYNHFDKIQKKEQLLHYLVRAARNRSISLWRRRKHQPEGLESHHYYVPARNSTPDVNLDVELVYKAMDKLPEKQRHALMLFEVSGFSMREIAEMQNSTEGAVRAKICRGRQKLRKMMTEKVVPIVFLGIVFSKNASAKTSLENNIDQVFGQLRATSSIPSKEQVIHSFQQAVTESAVRNAWLAPIFNQLNQTIMSTFSIGTLIVTGGLFFYSFQTTTEPTDFSDLEISEASIGSNLYSEKSIATDKTPNHSHLTEESVVENTVTESEIKSSPEHLTYHPFPKVSKQPVNIKKATKRNEISQVLNTRTVESSTAGLSFGSSKDIHPSKDLNTDCNSCIQEEKPKTAVKEAAILTTEISNAFIYGTVTTFEGKSYTGQIRWSKEEAFWTDMFNANKSENEHIDLLSREDFKKLKEQQNKNCNSTGVNLVGNWNYDYSHQFTCQFGDIKSIQNSSKRKSILTLKDGQKLRINSSGNDSYPTVFVFTKANSEVKLQWEDIEKVEFSATPSDLESSIGTPLYGKVKSWAGEFEGYIIWDEDERVSSDILDGATKEDGDMKIKFGEIKSLKKAGKGTNVTLKDGSKHFLFGTNDVNSDNGGVLVVIPNQGTITVHWDEFEEVTFTERATVEMKSYTAFAAPSTITGTVTTNDGKTISGRLAYDLDEQYAFEMLDGYQKDIEYEIPFYNVKSITPSANSSSVALKSGDTYTFKDTQDVNSKNTGILVFAKGDKTPTYILWENVKTVNFD